MRSDVTDNLLVLAVAYLLSYFGLYEEAIGESYSNGLLGTSIVFVGKVCELAAEVLAIILDSDDCGYFLLDLFSICILKEGNMLLSNALLNLADLIVCHSEVLYKPLVRDFAESFEKLLV